MDEKKEIGVKPSSTEDDSVKISSAVRTYSKEEGEKNVQVKISKKRKNELIIQYYIKAVYLYS